MVDKSLARDGRMDLSSLTGLGLFPDCEPSHKWLGYCHKRRGGDGGEGTLSRRLVSPKSDEGGSETQAEAQHHGKGRARQVKDETETNSENRVEFSAVACVSVRLQAGPSFDEVFFVYPRSTSSILQETTLENPPARTPIEQPEIAASGQTR